MKHGDIMSYIEDFNRRLNKSIKETPKSDEQYIEQITTSVHSVLRQRTSWDKVCIIGAGRCRDVPIMLFLEHFKQVIVTDIDLQSIEQCTKNRRNLILKQIEYTGFSDAHFFDRFGEKMWSAKSEEEIDQFIDDTISQVEHYHFLPDEIETYDFVYVSPIYTQLILHQTMNEMNGLLQDGYDPKLVEYMQEKLLTEMPGIIERFNNNLLRLLKKNGILFVLSDVFELEENTEFHRKITHSIKNQDVMNEIYQNYYNTYGFGLGDYGLYNLTTKLDVIRHRWLLWKFSNTRSFAIHLYTFQNNKGGTK